MVMTATSAPPRAPAPVPAFAPAPVPATCRQSEQDKYIYTTHEQSVGPAVRTTSPWYKRWFFHVLNAVSELLLWSKRRFKKAQAPKAFAEWDSHVKSAIQNRDANIDEGFFLKTENDIKDAYQKREINHQEKSDLLNIVKTHKTQARAR
jgi:hypothetical protein